RDDRHGAGRRQLGQDGCDHRRRGRTDRDRPGRDRLASWEGGHHVNPILAHGTGADESMSLVMLFAGIWVGWIGWACLRGTGFGRLPHWGAWALIGVAATLVVTATFVPRMIIGPVIPTAVPGAARPSSPAELTFVQPHPGAKESGDSMTVQMNLQNATL